MGDLKNHEKIIRIRSMQDQRIYSQRRKANRTANHSKHKDIRKYKRMFENIDLLRMKMNKIKEEGGKYIIIKTNKLMKEKCQIENKLITETQLKIGRNTNIEGNRNFPITAYSNRCNNLFTELTEPKYSIVTNKLNAW